MLMRIAFLMFPLAAIAADWPQYRGPNRDDVSLEKGLLQSWPAAGPGLLWTFTEAGVGYSGPAIVDERLFLTGGRGDKEFLFALDLKSIRDGTVRELWAVEIGPLFEFKSNKWSAGPSATPTVDGNLVFAVGGNGDLVCVDITTGIKQYVVFTNPGLAGVSAKDGKVLWNHRRKQAYGTEVINSPIIKDGMIYTTVAAGNGCSELIKVEKDNDTFKTSVVYSNRNLMNHHGNVLLLGDNIFGNGQGAGWACQNFKTGAIVWAERARLQSGAVTCADGRLYCLTEGDGTAALVEASEKAWKEHGRFKIPTRSKLKQPQGQIWTPPVVSTGRLFLRDQELLYCYDVSVKK